MKIFMKIVLIIAILGIVNLVVQKTLKLNIDFDRLES